MDRLTFRENVYSDYSLKLTYKGAALNLNNYDIRFKMFDMGNVQIIDNPASVIGDPLEGQFTYNFNVLNDELGTKGKYKGYFLFEVAGVAVLSYPKTGYIEIRVDNDFIT